MTFTGQRKQQTDGKAPYDVDYQGACWESSQNLILYQKRNEVSEYTSNESAGAYDEK